MDLIAIGNRIKQCRKHRKFTQEALAETLNVSPHYIYEIERGSKAMSLKVLVALAETLELSTDYILFGLNTDSSATVDNLDSLTRTLSDTQRIAAFDILSATLPHLK
mgnify:CR=1 FL=1